MSDAINEDALLRKLRNKGDLLQYMTERRKQTFPDMQWATGSQIQSTAE